MLYAFNSKGPNWEINASVLRPRAGEGIEPFCEQLFSFMTWNGNATQRQHNRHISQLSHHNQTLQPGLLKQLTFLFSQFWRLEV